MKRVVGLLIFVLAAGACGAVTVGASAECANAVNKLDESGKDGSEPIAQAQLQQTVNAAVDCIDPDDVVNNTAGWHLNERPLPAQTVDCLEPMVKRDMAAFLKVGHNTFHDLPTKDGDGATWSLAMATCVPASYVFLDRYEEVVSDPATQQCVDDRYRRPENLLPYFENMALQDERVPYSDWEEADLDLLFDDLYECVDFLPSAYPPEVTESVSPATAACLRQMLKDYHVASRAGVSDDEAAEIDEVAFNCFTPEERQSIFGS